MGFAAFTLNLLFLSESYPPMILVAKAEELRRRTRNWGIHAKQEEIEIDFRELLEKNFSRPLRMLVTERIVLLLSVYMAFIYGLLYLFLTAYPLVFQGVHRMNPGVGGLPFFGAIIGELLAGTLVFVRQPGYQKKLAANNNVPIPEWRLPEVIAGGVCFAGGIFWFGWTGYKADIHWIVPTLSGLLIGFGIMSIFLQAFNYLIDAYLMVRKDRPSHVFAHANARSSLPPRRLLQTRSFVVFVELRSLSSHDRCLRAWVLNGLLRCLDVLLLQWFLCRFGFTYKVRRLGRRAPMHRRTSQLPYPQTMRWEKHKVVLQVQLDL